MYLIWKYVNQTALGETVQIGRPMVEARHIRARPAGSKRIDQHARVTRQRNVHRFHILKDRRTFGKAQTRLTLVRQSTRDTQPKDSLDAAE